MSKAFIKALLVDDEQGNLDNLSALLCKHCTEIEIVGKANSVAEAYLTMQQNDVQVVFLDIQMPYENGFELLKKFDKINFEVIFVTAFDLYGIQAVKFSALDYLLKPIDSKELISAVDKLALKINSKKEATLIENLKLQLSNPTDKAKHKIALPSTNETFLIKIEDIIYCKSDNSYTTFYLKDNISHIICKSIKEYEILLSEYDFIRVHQSYLVNKEYVKSVSKKDGILLILIENHQVPVSKNRKEEVFLQLGL